MSNYVKTLIFMLALSFYLISCSKSDASNKKTESVDKNPEIVENPTGSKMKLIIGSTVFTATLSNSVTGTAFKARLPFTIKMNELNGNEKFFDLENSLPSNPANPGTIQTGDLMLYGSNTLVLFYKKFSTSYRYTNIGRIDNLSGLATALGSGNVSVTFAAE